MQEKRRIAHQLLEKTPEAEIHIIYMTGGDTHVEFTAHQTDTPEAMALWKKAITEAEGIWEDREVIEEELQGVRKELNRSFPR